MASVNPCVFVAP